MNVQGNQRMLLEAIDEAIRNEMAAQQEYKTKAELYRYPMFERLAEFEQEHEQMLRELRARVLGRIKARSETEDQSPAL